MQNYEELLWEKIPGSTPKEKYDYFIELERDIIIYKSAKTMALIFAKGMKGSPDSATIADLRSIIDVNYQYFVEIEKPKPEIR